MVNDLLSAPLHGSFEDHPHVSSLAGGRRKGGIHSLELVELNICSHSGV
jgi:hypothetical protein